MQRSWVVVVPVKRLEVAKSRLNVHLGTVRRDLALAMVLDTVTVAAACRGVRVIVVTDDDVVSEAVRAAHVQVVTDEPSAGINAALVHGARAAGALDGAGVVALSGDLPSLRSTELALALGRASRHPRSFVADAAGTGTTMYAATSRRLFEPRFGANSAVVHALAATAIGTEGLRGLRRDVDTLEDLCAAVELGLGPRTAHVVTSQVVALLGEGDLPAIRPAS